MMMVFPGQGSQQSGMGKFLFDNFSEAREVFTECSDAISLDIKKLCFDSSDSDLTLTENTQPALLTVSSACFRVLSKRFGVKTEASAGHSIGEYAALVAAGSMSLSSAANAVRVRGQAMQAAVPRGQGGMAAMMGLDPAQVTKICADVATKTKEVLSPANYNAPGQIVISGSTKALAYLKENPPVDVKMRMIPLQVSAPFHCALMKPAEDKMREVLSSVEFADASFPIIQNFTARQEQRALHLRENLIKQVSGSVQWTQSMQVAAGQGWLKAIECGHGKVLQGLLKKIDARFEVLPCNSLDDLKLIEKTAIGAL